MDGLTPPLFERAWAHRPTTTCSEPGRRRTQRVGIGSRLVIRIVSDVGRISLRGDRQRADAPARTSRERSSSFPRGVLFDQALIGKGAPWIVVPPPVPGMAGKCIEIPPVLLGVLTVVGLCARQAKDPFLEDRVASVPESESEAKPLFDIAKAGQAVLTPAIRGRRA